MSTKNKKIEKLFSKYFEFDDFSKKVPAEDFKCPYQSSCKVNPKKQPIYTSATGDNNTNVMAIGEAPSSIKGIGPHVGGKFSEVKENYKSPLYALKIFVKENFNTIPYFTDMVKCGVSKQSEKGVLKKRFDNCIEIFLLNEIKILKPKTILCIGTKIYNKINKKLKNKIDPTINVVKLMHYSRQAMMPLSTEDKLNIIWKIQLNFLNEEDLKDISIMELSYIRNYINEREKS